MKTLINTETRVIYKAFGLTIRSEIPLPELLTAEVKDTSVDVEIKLQDLQSQWNDLLSNPPQKVVVKKNFVMFCITDTAIFSVQDGNLIAVSPIAGADENKIRLYILGTCMGAILMQRKTMPLHGSAIEINGKAYAFVGESGAGKSTLAAAFLEKGYRLISDDVIAVAFSRNQTPVVMPSYPQQKLWEESLKGFGMDEKFYLPLFERETKYAIPVQDKFLNSVLPLGGVFELIKGEGDAITLNRIQSLSKLTVFFQHTFRSSFLSPLGLMDWHFHASTKIINQIEMYQLQRPLEGFTANMLVEKVIRQIGTGQEDKK
nr:aldolase [Falsibacillus pallidus]